MPLETSPQAPAPVRQIAMSIQGWIGRLGAVWVEGQVAQVSRRPGMNTVFLTLRDSVADVSLNVTAPRSVVDSMNPPLIDGASVVVFAKPDFYPNRGTLSLAAREIRMVGLGELLARLERRRQLLAAEGLFDPALKRDLPFLPERIGLVTAPHSAAEGDVLENARKRWPGVSFEIAYAAMQGPRAVPEILAGLERLAAHPDVDVIVIARGGGSVEDLLPFSDEALLRAVHKLRTPVVSAIGHDQDTPLLDLVADVRASTPTDAAKLLVPDVVEELRGVEYARQRVRALTTRWFDQETQWLASVRSRPSLADPRSLVVRHADEVAQLRGRARRVVGHRLDREGDDVGHRRARVRALSPLATLQRGYAVVRTADGHVLTDVTDTEVGAVLDVVVARGRLSAAATEIQPTDATTPPTTPASTEGTTR